MEAPRGSRGGCRPTRACVCSLGHTSVHGSLLNSVHGGVLRCYCSSFGSLHKSSSHSALSLLIIDCFCPRSANMVTLVCFCPLSVHCLAVGQAEILPGSPISCPEALLRNIGWITPPGSGPESTQNHRFPWALGRQGSVWTLKNQRFPDRLLKIIDFGPLGKAAGPGRLLLNSLKLFRE